MLEDSKQEHLVVDIIGCVCTRELGKKRTPKKCTTERFMKIDEKNSKKEGEIIITRKTWESNVYDGKINKLYYVKEQKLKQTTETFNIYIAL